MRPEDHDWHKVQELATQLQREGRTQLSEAERALLRRVAPEVAISDAETEKALEGPSSGVDLAMEVGRRIREGSRRLMRAISEAHRLHAAGDMPGARRRLEDLLAVEVVPLYRKQAEAELAHLG